MKRLSSIICFLSVSVALLTSCLESDDTYNAGFAFRKPTQAINSVYANNVVDSVVIFSYGNWSVRLIDGQAGWCTFDRTQGNAETVYSIPLHFQQNATGNSRSATFRFYDANHPDEAYVSLFYWQYATRGDGSLGSAADVKAITGTDGSRFEFAYDNQHRPTSLNISKDGVSLHSLSLRFNDYDSTLTVNKGSSTLRGTYGNDYQPMMLVGETDTVGYYSQYYDGYYQASANYAFNIEHRSYGQPAKRYALKLGGQSLQPDSLHNADSLRIAHTTGISTTIDKYKLTYSTADNRCQSVDVNQLVFGAEQCDPYQLLSLFRYARNTSIVSSVEQVGENYEVTVSLNADKSVAKMTVIRTRKAFEIGATDDVNTVTYTFEY